MPVAVLTDSTAYLPRALAAELGIRVVPLYVVLAGRSGREGEDISSEDVARALSARGQRVSTSRPTPGDFVAAYRAALDAGADRLVSVHLSAELSGTWDAARVAASQVGEHIVSVVDSRSAAMGTGFAVLEAARAAAAGADGDTVQRIAVDAAARTRTLFVVDTLEHLRRGGRIGSAAAVLGSALAVKPVLHVVDGRVVPLEKVRTSTRALARLVQHVVEHAGEREVSLAVHHLAAAERADRLVTELRARVPRLRDLHVSELGAAIGAHVGPGAVGVVLCTAPEPADGGEAEGAG
ncbi:DegV family protein [Blastococcus sp. MG754426]|uniref:DegV family protein n=1 Tax=unclassified Blastococcus TaxID=2619396 RepID=UPI001EF0C7FB|nr:MULTISPECIES: DegV family protein [unclassified Blastococcus]MCF6507636.1 DegV family protein [Blastococcus sp. MG754426]MCF6512721.1 DegV family protein [Blastococcus sp. MG754427]MCF6735853.1 DegV family protein [Blastococcus sp. KM273129]